MSSSADRAPVGPPSGPGVDSVVASTSNEGKGFSTPCGSASVGTSGEASAGVGVGFWADFLLFLEDDDVDEDGPREA